MNTKYAQYLLNKTKEDYNRIAQVFNKTRNYIPPDLEILKTYVQPGDRVLDLGCGNGRLYEIMQGMTDYYGADVSEKIIEIAREKYPKAKFFITDPLSLPFEDNFFDKVFCLSVFHHIPSQRFRLKFLKEINRVLKPDRVLILTVWNLWPKKKIRHLLFKYTLLKLIGKSRLGFFDIMLPWKNGQGETIINRYIHVFRRGELNKLLKKAGFKVQEVKIIKRSKKESNIFVLAKKVS